MARPVEQFDERAALVRLVRDEGARVLATLVRTTGSWQLAEDAVQDAVVRALERWPRDGIPPEPRAWLTVTARRRAIDLIRREVRRGDKEVAAAALRELDAAEPPEGDVVRDDLLRLLFTCCHPALSVETQTALALRTLGGLSTDEIASSLLVTPSTMAKRLTRARRKIEVARIPYEPPSPEELPERLRGVLAVIYLMFNEGYHASAGDGPLRRRLTGEAIRLVTLLRELLPDRAPVLGLAALLHLQDARRPARLDSDGEPVRLAEQDRSRWDRQAITRGMTLLGLALRGTPMRPDPYVVQAAIAACHDLAPTWEATNWEAIVSWYDVLLTVHDTPVVRLGRAVAVGELRGPETGLAELEPIEGLEHHLPFVAARAELLARCGRLAEARAAYRAALGLPTNAATRRSLAARLAELG
ncbi:MAG TPA: sigma-70 family RNA polymerase sigma factor [Solirubrobacteraceae bacterium]|nr:sigma-70 family RNA polymerase sigma factor [Solirubrobacteraceae bacterium]